MYHIMLRGNNREKTFIDEEDKTGIIDKRSKFPDQPENLKLWLDGKNNYFECAQSDFNLAFSKELPDRLKKALRC